MGFKKIEVSTHAWGFLSSPRKGSGWVVLKSSCKPVMQTQMLLTLGPGQGSKSDSELQSLLWESYGFLFFFFFLEFGFSGQCHPGCGYTGD